MYSKLYIMPILAILMYSKLYIIKMLVFIGTAGLALDENLGVRWHSGCRCPISIPSPDSESWWKTTHSTFNDFLVKQELSLPFFLLVLYGVIGYFFPFLTFCINHVSVDVVSRRVCPRWWQMRTFWKAQNHPLHTRPSWACREVVNMLNEAVNRDGMHGVGE